MPEFLTEKYRPARIAEFIGLDKPKRILSRLAQNPYSSNWIFSGPSGTGKTTLALAFAQEIGAEVQHVSSQNCTVAEIDRVWWANFHRPMFGKRFWVNLVDEADTMSKAAQDSLLSKLDTTERAPETIWIFTCNSTEKFEPRFMSRNIEIPFSSYGIASDVTSMLAKVWRDETGQDTGPNFNRIVKENANNIRASLMALQFEIMAA